MTALSACSETPQPSNVELPSDISAACDPLPVFDGVTSDDLVSYDLDLIDKYKDCSARHSGVAE